MTTKAKPSAVRKEDARLVAGDGRYTADWNLPGQLHAARLRSERAHAEIRRLDAQPALGHRGVRAVLTGEDVRAAGFKSLPAALAFTGKGGQALLKPHHPILASGRVRSVGEPVAMVIPDTPAIAADARDPIAVQDPEPPAAV